MRPALPPSARSFGIRRVWRLRLVVHRKGLPVFIFRPRNFESFA